MIEVNDIRIFTDYPGYAGVIVDVRLIDKSQGTHVTEDGFELFNYDKFFTYKAADLDYAVEQAGNRITEILSETNPQHLYKEPKT